MYTCKPCNFTLHQSCTQMPLSITHSFHPKHTLTLLPTSAYHGGSFNCHGCGHQGHGFSYHCNHCDFYLHVLCASKPLLLAHQSHPHQLTLTFAPPYHTKDFTCHICHKIGFNHWLYRCTACMFDAHLDCATNTPRPLMAQPQPQPQISHYNSFTGAYNMQQYGNNSTAGGMNYYVQSQSVGSMLNYQAVTSGANALMGTAIEGLVNGAAKGVGQNIVRSITKGGSDDSGAGGGGDDSFSSIIDNGFSILSRLFGGLSDIQN